MDHFNKTIVFFLILLLPTLVSAEYDLNDNCRKAYQQIMTMRFDDALVTLAHEDHPGFWLNNKMAGTFNVIFSFIPSSFQWAAKVIGLRGNREAGIKQLEQYHRDAAAINGMAEESVNGKSIQ